MPLVQVKDKAEALGVISGSGQKENEDNGESNVKKVKPPDKDTMTVKVPLHKEHSTSSIGPIWNDAASTSKDSQVSSHLYSQCCLRDSSESSILNRQLPVLSILKEADGDYVQKANALNAWWQCCGNCPTWQGAKHRLCAYEALGKLRS